MILSKDLPGQRLRCRSPRMRSGPDSSPRIGILWPNPLTASGHFVDAFRRGLQELGYVDGKNVIIEYRSADGHEERLAGLARELVSIPVDVIQTATSPTIRAAQQATSTIPIVMGNSQDPVSEGFVASLARPGGDLRAKRFSLQTWLQNDFNSSKRLYRHSRE